jgi:PEP-CTERM motif
MIALIVLYSNGAASQNDTNAWRIGPAPPPHGPAVTNSFYIGQQSIVTAFSFAVWVAQGDTPTGVDYEIGTTAFDYDVALGSTVLSNIKKLPWSNTSTLCFSSSTVCDVYEVTGTVFPSVSLATGTYWLTLSNGYTTGFGVMLWDENGGAGCTGWSNNGPCPSDAYNNFDTVTPNPSEDPDIIGHLAAPEPDSILLFGSGIVGLVGILRRKLKE